MKSFVKLLFLLPLSIASFAQTNPSLSTEQVNERVHTLIETALREGRRTLPGGVIAITRVPPSNESLQEISELGTPAITPLTRYLLSSDPRAQELAIRFMRRVGGEEIVEPIAIFLGRSEFQGNRVLALEALTEAPADKAIPVIKEETNDPDPVLKNKAIELLKRLQNR